MTTQPSDWAVARAFWILYAEETPHPFSQIYAEEVIERARELDGSGSEAYAKANPLGGPATMFETIARRLRAGEAYAEVLADYGLAQAPGAGEWLPIESAPDDIGLCVVYTPDQGDGERFDIDWKEDGVWQEHYNHYEHFMAVGGANACGPDMVCSGPGERPDYTHYRRLTAPQAAMGAVGAGD